MVRSGGIFGKELHVLRRGGVFVNTGEGSGVGFGGLGAKADASLVRGGVFSARNCTFHLGLAFSLARAKAGGVVFRTMAAPAGVALARSGGIFGKDLHVIRRAGVFVSADEELGCRVGGAGCASGCGSGAERGYFRQGIACFA